MSQELRRASIDGVLQVTRSNTILYVEPWSQVVAFYRDGLGLPVTFENDWFVELLVHAGGYVSVADAARASIAPGDGRGLTLSWEVDDVRSARAELAARAVVVSDVMRRWEAEVVDLFDPAGNRIELWSTTGSWRDRR